ncbi:MAG: DUF3147 family protein [Deltaproteobacteria bacterium]|nr:DUF3147 family protein [Deltaproteobacteria bacterium]
MFDLVSWMSLIKIVVAIIMVVVVTLLAEHVSTRFAGIFSGYPLGSAITLFFIGLEVGPRFAGDAAVYTMMGLVSLQSLLYVYYRVTRRIGSGSSVWAILLSTICGAFVFIVIGLVLKLVDVSTWMAAVISMFSIIFFDRVFKNLENARIEKSRKTSLKLLMLRALFAAVSILIITLTAAWLGQRWSGLLAAFPVTMLPMMIIIHYSYRKEHVYTIIKNVPRGLVCIVIYCSMVAATYPTIGVGWGTLTAYILATIYLVLISINYPTIRWYKPRNIDVGIDK